MCLRLEVNCAPFLFQSQRVRGVDFKYNGECYMTTTLITGGARSGKSTLAQEIGKKTKEEILFVATAKAGDQEMKRRIKAHKKSRPAGWKTKRSSCIWSTSIC